ncbi:MAG: hypothetical protein C4533_01495 [Candidatus Omnitrophota bacterium]|jgi:hypothetical protein|nr:MAG: hypothetical protein C4533_01495 [Candidatus Omnitrophota bacterium]
MKKKNIIIISSVVVILGLLLLSVKLMPGSMKWAKQEKDKSLDFPYLGEKIIYEVKFGKIPLGSAVFTYLPPETAGEGMMLSHMRFETSVARLKDTEDIYCDPKTMLPIKIKREIVKWIKKENIVEEYDQKNFSLKITKNGNSEESVFIKKDSPIHNAVLLPFYVRGIADLKKGWQLKVALPQKNFIVTLDSVEKVKVPAGEFLAYHFVSEPAAVEIWITVEKRIPVKIEGLGAFGYSLQMKELLKDG